MLRATSTIWFVAGIVFLSLATAGCGGPQPRTINGKLVLPPKIKLSENDAVNVAFVADGGEEGEAFVADVSVADMTFTANVPPGKYKVAVSITPYPGEKDSEKRTETLEPVIDQFSAASTPLTYEVTSDATQSITVDMAEQKVTKN